MVQNDHLPNAAFIDLKTSFAKVASYMHGHDMVIPQVVSPCQPTHVEGTRTLIQLTWRLYEQQHLFPLVQKHCKKQLRPVWLSNNWSLFWGGAPRLLKVCKIAPPSFSSHFLGSGSEHASALALKVRSLQ